MTSSRHSVKSTWSCAGKALFRIIFKGSRRVSPFKLNNDPWQTLNQLREADMVYVRDFRDPASLDDDQLRHLGLIAHACYGSYDLSYRCVLFLEERKAIAAGSGNSYINLINMLLQRSS